MSPKCVYSMHTVQRTYNDWGQDLQTQITFVMKLRLLSASYHVFCFSMSSLVGRPQGRRRCRWQKTRVHKAADPAGIEQDRAAVFHELSDGHSGFTISGHRWTGCITLSYSRYLQVAAHYFRRILNDPICFMINSCPYECCRWHEKNF
jgi:hypothetical protein